MAKTRYKINGDQIINVKGFGRLTNENINDEIAEKLLSSGGYDGIIIPDFITDPDTGRQIELPTFKKKKKNNNSENVDKEQDNKSPL